MRKLLRALPALILLAILQSCSTGKASIDNRRTDLQQSKEINENCFIQLKDGSIRNYSSLKLVTGVMKTPYLLADGKTRIKPAEIKAYQNADHYAISQTAFGFGTPTTYVAVETLPGFAVRIAKGKLNIYRKQFFNGSNAADQYFLEAGDGMFIKYSATAIIDILKDSNEALSYFNNSDKKDLTKILQATANIYNGQLLSKN